MSTKSHQEDKDIGKTLKMAFWDRTVPPQKWKKAISQEDPECCHNVIVSSFKFLPIRWVVQQIGEEIFIKRWPILRRTLEQEKDPLVMQRIEAWDAVWGILSVGDSQYPIRPEVASLGRKKRDLLRAIVQNGACSAYGLSKSSGRDYSRVYKDVQELAEAGLVCVRKERAKGRTVNILKPAFSVNSDLWELKHG